MVWYDARDSLSGRNGAKNGLEIALEKAAMSKHPEAVWFCTLAPYLRDMASLPSHIIDACPTPGLHEYIIYEVQRELTRVPDIGMCIISAQKGYLRAMAIMSIVWTGGQPKDDTLEYASENGDPWAMYCIASRTKDIQKLKRSAMLGHVAAQIDLFSKEGLSNFERACWGMMVYPRASVGRRAGVVRHVVGQLTRTERKRAMFMLRDIQLLGIGDSFVDEQVGYECLQWEEESKAECNAWIVCAKRLEAAGLQALCRDVRKIVSAMIWDMRMED